MKRCVSMYEVQRFVVKGRYVEVCGMCIMKCNGKL